MNRVHSREALIPAQSDARLVAKLEAGPTRLLDALAECKRHTDRGVCYWWRKASMATLEEMGLVEKWTPRSVAERPRMSSRPWRLTETGIAILRAKASRDAHPSTAGYEAEGEVNQVLRAKQGEGA